MRGSLVRVVLVCARASAVTAGAGGGSGCGGGGGGGEQITVGYAGPTLNNAFFVGLQKGVKDGAKEHGFRAPPALSDAACASSRSR